VCTLVRVAVPHSGRYVGIASYTVQQLREPHQSFEVWFDCSTWRWLDVGRGLMEFELVYRVLKATGQPVGDAGDGYAGDPHVGCVGAEVFEGVYDWEQDAIEAKGIFLRAVPQEVATLRPPSSPLTRSAAAAERAARPWWVHLSREELCGELLRRLDADGDGRLLSDELRALAGRLGCEHSDEEWEEEYLAACELCGARPEAGLDAAQLLVFIDGATEAAFVDLAGLLEEPRDGADEPSSSDWFGFEVCICKHGFLNCLFRRGRTGSDPTGTETRAAPLCARLASARPRRPRRRGG